MKRKFYINEINNRGIVIISIIGVMADGGHQRHGVIAGDAIIGWLAGAQKRSVVSLAQAAAA